MKFRLVESNELEKRAKKHRSSIAKGGIGWFQEIGGKKSIDAFNKSTKTDAVPTAASPDGGSSISGDAGTGGAVGEALTEGAITVPARQAYRINNGQTGRWLRYLCVGGLTKDKTAFSLTDVAKGYVKSGSQATFLTVEAATEVGNKYFGQGNFKVGTTNQEYNLIEVPTNYGPVYVDKRFLVDYRLDKKVPFPTGYDAHLQYKDGFWVDENNVIIKVDSRIDKLVAPVGVIAPTNCSFLLANCEATKIDLRNLDTSNVIDMRGMFSFCSSLKSLDLSSFDTSNVKNMSYMFDGCKSLKSLDLSDFDTSNVIDMNRMFYGCNSLTSLNLSSLNTSNVKNMSCMFDGCKSLKSLDLSNFNTSKVQDMWDMFSDCNSLTSLDLSSFDTSNVRNMSYMFINCRSLTSLDLSSFDTSNVEYMNGMFCGCRHIQTFNLSNISITNKCVVDHMFDDTLYTDSEDLDESIGSGYSRKELCDAIKKYKQNYKLDKYTNQQLYNILNRLYQENPKLPNKVSQTDSDRGIKSSKDLTRDANYEYQGSVNNRKIYRRKDTGDWGVEGYSIRFATEEDAIDFVKEK